MPKNVALVDGKFIHNKNKEELIEGPSEKMSKSKKNVIEPNEILENYGIDATRIFMISDSPPDRELEWTDEGIQSAKNLTNRIERYFDNDQSEVDTQSIKTFEKFIFNMENNILNFALNKCVANIYTLFNFLEKNKIFLGKNDLSKKLLVCLFPIIPRLSSSLYNQLFNKKINQSYWPQINQSLLEDNNLILPIQVMGKLITTIDTKKDYNEEKIIKEILELVKIKNKIKDKKIKKIINVQNKIINIITN